MDGVRLSGRIAWLVWLVIHITFLTGFKNRFTDVIRWFLWLSGTGRSERAITTDLDRLLAHGGQPVLITKETVRRLNDPA
jgi:hypothetical protein